jgi:Ran GTPase-activating protein (RanGAP) involved in mRNA processing and transport
MTSQLNLLGKNMFGYFKDFLNLQDKLIIFNLNSRARRFIKDDKQLKIFIYFLEKFNSLKHLVFNEERKIKNVQLAFEYIDGIKNDIKSETCFDIEVISLTIKHLFYYIFGNEDSIDLTEKLRENFFDNLSLLVESQNEIISIKPRNKLKTIKIKSLDPDDITSEKLEILLDSIEISKTVETLHLENFKNSLSLTNKLRRTVYNEKISSVTLINIKFCYDYIKEFSQCLAFNKTLTYLKMNSNNLTDYDVLELASNLEKNSSIRILDLSYNFMTFRGAKRILEILDHNIILENIYFSHNLIDFEENADLIRVFKANKMNLKILDLSTNFISNLGAKYLAYLIGFNSSLLEINLANSKNRIDDEGYKYLNDVFCKHNSLKKIILEDK